MDAAIFWIVAEEGGAPHVLQAYCQESERCVPVRCWLHLLDVASLNCFHSRMTLFLALQLKAPAAEPAIEEKKEVEKTAEEKKND